MHFPLYDYSDVSCVPAISAPSLPVLLQAYTELFEALDDRTFAHEERHLDKLYLERIMAQFQIAIRGATPGAQM